MTDQTQINQQLTEHAQAAASGQSGSAAQGDNTQVNQTLIKEIIPYIQLSAMPQKEKAMWLLLLPAMEEKHLLKLKTSLTKEVNAVTDIYLKALSNPA